MGELRECKNNEKYFFKKNYWLDFVNLKMNQNELKIRETMSKNSKL